MRLKKRKGFAIITLIMAMVLMASLGVGIYTLTTSSTFSELLASRDYNAYQLAKAGLRYAAFINGDASGTYCMSGGQCFTIAIDTTNTDPTIKRYTSKGYVNQGTFLAANRQLAYNMPNPFVGGGACPGGICFDQDMGDIPQPGVGWGMNKEGAVEVNYVNKQILLGDGSSHTTDSFGSVVYGGGSYTGNCSYGICDFGAGIHAYFEFNFSPEDHTSDSTHSADGFTFALFNGTNNLVTATGGAPPDVSSLGELVGYAGPGTHGPGWQPPKLAIEFDSYPNTGDFSITRPGSRRDPIPFRDHMALMLWGENNAAPYRPDANIANAVGLRCAPNDEFVRSLYRSILGRNAELGGLQGWTSGLNGQTTTTLQNTARYSFFGGFFGSGEYTGKNTSDVQYVTDVFKAVLGMQAPTVPTGACPAGQFYAEYYNNRNLTGTPVFTRCEAAPINYDWGTGGPGNGIGVDDFSVRWSGQFLFAGSTTFTARADDGVRVWVDGNRIINRWVDQGPTTYTATRTLDAGVYPVVMEYYERGGGAVAQLSLGTISRPAFLDAVLASTQYTNNVNSCGTYSYNTTAQMGTYNCGGVSRVGTSLDCSGLPLSLYNRDTLDDNVHSEGLTESSFTALPLSPKNSGNETGSYYAGPDRQCASSGNTCRWFEDGYTHKFRIEVLRDTTSHTCSRDYTGSGGAAAGNCYNYQVKAWIDCDGGNPTVCTATQLSNMKNVRVAFTDPSPQINRTIELTESRHTQFNKMIFGWTGATGQPSGGKGQQVTLTNFALFFRTPQPCPAVTSITPASLPGGTVGTPYSQQTLAAAPTSAAPFTWAVIVGSLPAGLNLSPAGVISGTPTARGTSNFTVRATNICGSSLTRAYSIAVTYRCSGGNSITTSGDKTIHTFTASGQLSCPAAVSAEVLVVAGGGAGGGRHGGGGASGGLVYHAPYSVTGNITVTVGAGGNPTQTNPNEQSVGGNGQNSVFGIITALGGGGGGSYTAAVPTGGGSGGGGGGGMNTTHGLANQGNSGGGTGFGSNGGNGGSGTGGGGGGGAGGGGNAASANTGGNGGIGKAYSISGSSVYYAGGGGGGGDSGGGTGGLGGGGNGGLNIGTDGSPNTGGGGGGIRSNPVTYRGKIGGSGIVIISY